MWKFNYLDLRNYRNKRETMLETIYLYQRCDSFNQISFKTFFLQLNIKVSNIFLNSTTNYIILNPFWEKNILIHIQSCWFDPSPPQVLFFFKYTHIVTLLPFFIEMLQYDCLWSGHMIIKKMCYIPIKLKPELARASRTTSDVNNQWCSNFQQQII